MTSDDPVPFDVEAHRQRAEQSYQRVRPQYEELAQAIKEILSDAFKAASINVASIEARGKTVESFGNKASEPADTDETQPKYPEPLKQITDLAGVRVITFFPRTIEYIDQIITSEFNVVERIDKRDILIREERFGYQSLHFLVKLKPTRTRLPEYSRFLQLVAEIQVRTILQHAWAEIEHDIQYKSVETIPVVIRRRFMVLSGLLELADREFQAVQDEDKRLRAAARVSIDAGRLGNVEITADSLKAYLDKTLGPDGRMRSYDQMAFDLTRYGFRNLQQVADAVGRYDGDKMSRELFGSRMGQLGRFELMLLAALGNRFIDEHPFNRYDWWRQWRLRDLRKILEAGIETGTYKGP
jgi:putative GTP pyrophosphokinase